MSKTITPPPNAKTLHLNLHRKWFDMIAKGEKKEEYRAMTEYWGSRLKGKDYDYILFSNGYAKDRRQMLVRCLGITHGIGLEKWGAIPENVYIIILGYVDAVNFKLKTGNNEKN